MLSKSLSCVFACSAACLMALTAAQAAAAQTSGGAALTLAACVRLSRRRSPEAEQARFQEQAVSAALDAAERLKLPQLMGEANLLRSNQPNFQLPNTSQVNYFQLQLDQNLNPFSPAWESAKALSRDFGAARFRSREAGAQAALDARLAYFSLLQDGDALATLSKMKARLERLLSMVPPRYVQGLSLPLDSIEVRSALLDLDGQKADTLALLERDRDRLDLLLGMKPGTSLTLAPLGGLPPLPPVQSLDTGSNPAFLASREEASAGEARLAAARAERLPSLAVEADVGPAGQTAWSMDPGWGVGVMASLPVFEWGAISADVRKSRAEWAVLRSQAGSTRDLLESQWKETVTKAGLDLKVEQERRAFLPLASQAVKAVVN
ncbi:MAG: TolC family protein, partial [bacterium]